MRTGSVRGRCSVIDHSEVFPKDEAVQVISPNHVGLGTIHFGMDARMLSRTTLLAAVALAGLTACSDSDQGKAPAPAPSFSTDSLDDLAPPQPEPTAEPEPVVINQTTPAAEPTEQERQWERERQSQSGLGRTRDTVRTLTNRMQDGTEAEEGLAAVSPDEEWVGTEGFIWDMPADWRMAVPSSGRFGQMQVPSPLGAASVAFNRETGSVADLERRVASMMVSQSGGRITPRTENIEVLGRPVRLVSLEGSLLDPSAKGGTGETPFQAIRAAIVDLGPARALIVMWGPEDTVRNNEGHFEHMIRTMTNR